MKINRQGCTRIVFLTKRFAFKIPNFLYCYRNFLWGLLNNLGEVETSKNKDVVGRVCPILFHLPFGLLIVMPKVKVLSDEEYITYYDDIQALLHVNENCLITAENKSDSYGFYKGKIVVIDYGS